VVEVTPGMLAFTEGPGRACLDSRWAAFLHGTTS
jgi:hypothetical protein